MKILTAIDAVVSHTRLLLGFRMDRGEGAGFVYSVAIQHLAQGSLSPPNEILSQQQAVQTSFVSLLQFYSCQCSTGILTVVQNNISVITVCRETLSLLENVIS